MSWARKAWPDLLAAALVAVLVFAFFGHAFLNYDSFYALVWGDDLAHGRVPQYSVPVAPTPHPLATLAGIVLSPLGDHAETAFLVLVLLAIGALVVGMFRLGQTLYAAPVGVLAAFIVATRVPLLNYGIRGYVDLPTIALVVWAAVLEARTPRRGAPVLVLLGLAGLLRPELWGFAAVYWLWCAVPLGGRERARLAALALAAPVLWCLSDLLITGDPLWSLHGTSDLAAALGRRTGLGALPSTLPRRLGEILRLPELIAAVIGCAAGLVYLRRRTLLPLAIAVLNGSAFVVFAIAGLPLLGRYLFLSGAMLALLAALAALGWTALPATAPERGRWKIGGLVVLLAILVVFPVQQVGRLTALRTDIANRDRVEADLRVLVERPEARRAITACRPLYVPNHRPIPQLAYWTGRRPSQVEAIGTAPSGAGTYLSPATDAVAKLSVLDPRDPKPLGTAVPRTGAGPPGYREVARNRSWVLFAGACRG
ncbi:MAG: hypothetical protein QOJ07_531 [Thermoleophilaceae bacterium]|nr:hypothetical protein [Thermoleophilaceae bacterium]